MTEQTAATRAVRAGLATDTAFGAVVPPIYLTTNYTFESFGTKRQHDYARVSNPTRDLLGASIADLEGAAGAVVTATGTAAMTLLATVLLRPGDHVVIPHDCYGGTWRLFHKLSERGHFTMDLVDLTDLAAVEAALGGPTPPKVVWIETPSNPLLRVTDIAAVAALARAAGAIVVVDNTFLTPLLQQPISLGADYVVHSTTKYLNGHSDVISGAVAVADEERYVELAEWANDIGVTGSSFDSYLVVRGMRTLAARLRAHHEGAAAVVEALQAHPAVERVYYPGLPDHPGHDVARRQATGFGGIVSFDLAGGTTAAKAFTEALQIWSLAESLGGVESLVDHPPTMTHLGMTPEVRAEAGIKDGNIRLSVGIEDPVDLVADLVRGLDHAQRATQAEHGQFPV